jgi:hypothetical protein
VKQIGRDLNVRYVLEGSVQRGGGRMRVNVQLVDAENGKHLWAERFDKPVADLFDMQDEIVTRLAAQLGSARSPPRRAGRKRHQTPTRSTSIFNVWRGSTRSRVQSMWLSRAPFLGAPWRSSPTTWML